MKFKKILFNGKVIKPRNFLQLNYLAGVFFIGLLRNEMKFQGQNMNKYQT